MVSQNHQNQPPRPRVVVDLHRQQQPPLPHQPPRAAGRAGGGIGGVKDIRQTKEYKVAARRWLSVMVALPILMYTSWSLFERTYGEKSPKRLVPSTPGTTTPSATAAAAAMPSSSAEKERSE
ncbi:hypothetical protein BO78DRAFT_399239 [Aspergillus sclerotiicarbonarius CBS 121057]|uniref:Uncharacterized protein n=1 Tax=Aspergillus sclerotiicarbonarius (strain CBS 121057 / IBT 28362) TaxID=1448318 RepID=A0A319E1W2_ASPSB|nr:hypothetical protein BO78DRAFT_399239 [Aspergillus sclerotiicarbonarius CBS 121057]